MPSGLTEAQLAKLHCGRDILLSHGMQLEKQFIQHGSVTVYEHSLSVALMCIKIADRLKIRVDRPSLVRGALLHDYFLYDWHVKDKSHRLHGFHHAKRAMLNADRDFKLNPTEKNMILSHMFPLNLTVPKHRESVILCLSDKLCAAKETLCGIGKRLKTRKINLNINASNKRKDGHRPNEHSAS